MGCNVFAPFQSTNSQQDLLELGQQCLNNKNPLCAITYFNQLPSGTLKNENMCAVYTSLGGTTLDALASASVNASNVTNGFDYFIGFLAQALVPYSASNLNYLTANALQFCSQLTNNANPFLATLYYMSDCALRVAKTDQTVCTISGTGPTTNGNQNGHITRSDICTASSCTGNANNAMCSADALACYNDFIAVPAAYMSTSQYGSWVTTLTNLQNQIGALNPTTQMTAITLAIYNMVH